MNRGQNTMMQAAPRAWLCRLAGVALLPWLLAGCAGISADGGFGVVQQRGAPHLAPGQSLSWPRSEAEQAAVDDRVRQLLQQSLRMDDAVQLALLNNRGLQAAYAGLGIAEADRVQAGRLANPAFSFGRLTRGGEVETELGLHLGLSQLLLMPQARRVAAARLAQQQADVTHRSLALAADVRKAWVQAVAAGESLRYSGQVMQAAEAGAELARRMQQVGNFSRLQQAREQVFYADAALGHARAQQRQLAARERLTRLLGLWGAQAEYALPAQLPPLPSAARDWPEIERDALAQRLDVAAARAAVAHTAAGLGLSRSTRFVNLLELGLSHSREPGADHQRGWELRLELPVFDAGDVRVARAEQVYRQALHQAADVAVQARSEAREAYGSYRHAWDIARHQRDELVPLRARISEENLLRYNGMLIGVFELLADARVQIASVNAAIDALRDFWLADADLGLALVGRPGLAGVTFSNVSSSAAADAAPH